MSTKWAENCDPETPAREFARSVLVERMNEVESVLPLAAHHHTEDTEHVHQLRVGSRRAAATLRAFAPLMSKKPRKLKEWLSRIRDAAGPARDIDVLLDRFAKESPPDVVTSYAVERLMKERIDAQPQLVKVAKQALSGKLNRAVEHALKSLGKKKDLQTLGKFGQSAVRLVFAPFARLARLEHPTTAELHQFRIAGKRLRYSLEVFHGLFPAELREEIYPLVEDLQGRLGEINDHVTAQALFQNWLANMPADDLAAQVAQRVATEHKAALKLTRKFGQWWNEARFAKVDTFFHEYCVDGQ